MPQLNPKPWFLILLFSWLCFLLMIPSKVTSHLFTNPAKTRTTEEGTDTVWAWPWSGT